MVNMKNVSTNDFLKSLEALYLDKKYDQAIDQLLKHKEDFDLGLFHYNYGTMHLKKGEPAVAFYHYEQAIKKGMTSSEVFHNLNVAKAQLGQTNVEAKYDVKDQIQFYSAVIPTQAYVSLFLLLTLIVLVLKKIKTIKSWITVGVVTLLAFSPLMIEFFYFSELEFAINFEETAIHSGPSRVYDGIGTLPKGTKVLLGKHYNGWCYIEAPEILSGWVDQKQVAIYK